MSSVSFNVCLAADGDVAAMSSIWMAQTDNRSVSENDQLFNQQFDKILLFFLF